MARAFGSSVVHWTILLIALAAASGWLFALDYRETGAPPLSYEQGLGYRFVIAAKILAAVLGSAVFLLMYWVLDLARPSRVRSVLASAHALAFGLSQTFVNIAPNWREFMPIAHHGGWTLYPPLKEYRDYGTAFFVPTPEETGFDWYWLLYMVGGSATLAAALLPLAVLIFEIVRQKQLHRRA